MVKQISVAIPAFNEQDNIESAIDNVLAVVESRVKDYEIVVINDGSSDNTGDIAEQKAKTNSRIRVCHNNPNRGYGYSLKRAMKEARKEYFAFFPGDNDMSASTLGLLIDRAHEADVVLSYPNPRQNRPLYRRIISKVFICLMNFLFGLHLKYFNGAFICRVDVLREFDIKSNGLIMVAECVIKLIKSGHSYVEVAFDHIGRVHGKSTALFFKSVREVARTVGILLKDIYLPSSRGQ